MQRSGKAQVPSHTVVKTQARVTHLSDSCTVGVASFIEGSERLYCAILLLARLKHDLACQWFSSFFFLAHSKKGRRKGPRREAQLRNLPTLPDSQGLLEMKDKQHLRKTGLCCSMSMLLASVGWAMYSPATFHSHSLLTRITFILETKQFHCHLKFPVTRSYVSYMH